MRRLIATLAFLVTTAASAQLPNPSQFLGFEVGADRKLADYRQITSYFRALDAGSERISLEELGTTTLGEPMIMAIISSEANMAKLPRIREIAGRLADPRGLTESEAQALIAEGRSVVLVTCNIHSTEIASSQLAMEWAHALVSADDPTTRKRLDEAVVLLVPSLNPDGQIMEVEWYRKYLGTEFEGGRLPRLYHPYVGHDNNRDWFMLTQKETRNMSRAIYHEWFPQIFVDVHQMGSSGPRMFIPPFADPADPDVHPLIWREVNLIGSNMALRLEQAKKQGVIYGYQFDAYWVGGTRNTGWWKNITGLLLEIASARMATPLFVDPTELSGGGKGLPDYKTTVNHPNPWRGGMWRMRDIMDYERIACDALLEIAAERRADVLQNVYARARDAFSSEKQGDAYYIPAEQQDPATAKKLALLLADHNVEVRTDGSAYWVPLAQPYSRFIREMLEPQRYPEVRPTRESDILRPYDVASWTLPLMMGVRVERGALPAGNTLQRLEAPILNGGHYHPRAAQRTSPRVGIYKPWTASMDEGWTRWVLEQAGFNVVSIEPMVMKTARLRDRFDAIILPDIDAEVLSTGKPKRNDGEMQYHVPLPPEFRAALEDGAGKKGSENLREFVRTGGTLIALDSASNWVISNFNIPVRNVLLNAKAAEFEVPGSLVRLQLRGDHPVTSGMPATVAAFIDDNIAFETTLPGAESERWVLATYPETPNEILLSGWIFGEKKLAGRSALVATTFGQGKIVLFGFHPQNRAQTHATFPLLYNAIEWSIEKR